MIRCLSRLAVLFFVCTTSGQAASDQEALIRIEKYLNTITTLKSDFEVTFGNGAVVPGKAYLSRPGKMRLDYDEPMPLQVIADGTFLIHHDKRRNEVSWVGLSEAPTVALMTRSKITLQDQDVTVLKVEQTADTINVHLRLTEAPADMQSLIMIFKRSPLMLTRWIEEYEEGGDILVDFSDTKINTPLPDDLFIFNDPRFSDTLRRGRGR